MDTFDNLIPPDKMHILDGIKQQMLGITSGRVPDVPPSKWRGCRSSPAFDLETVIYAYETYEFEKDTVFIICFPKTGTNWCTEVVRQIMYGHDEKLDRLSKAFPPIIFSLEMAGADKFQLLEHIPLPRKLFQSHVPEELVNLEKIKKSNGKVIIVVRNPKDQAVSLFNFIHNLPGDFMESNKTDWSVFIADYMQGKITISAKEGEWYPDHILGWSKHKDDPNVLFVHYEDMKMDLKKEIRRIAKFIQIDLEDQRVDNIAQGTTFSNMKKKVEAESDEFSDMRSNLNIMRKGQVGGWKDIFTVAQSERMDEIFEEKLGKTGIKFTYE